MTEAEGLLQGLVRLGSDTGVPVSADLARHFMGTYERLRQWQASDALCKAGMYHAVYGTYGEFHRRLADPERRPDVAAMIGKEAEEIAYFFCACDRAWFWPLLMRDETPEYRNRFTGVTHVPSREAVAAFCELTAANESDECGVNREWYLSQYGLYVLPLLTSQLFRSHLSDPAAQECERTFPAP